jgi:hypothetical protein
MRWQDHRKAPCKVNERIVTSNGSFAIRNRVHWRVVFATMGIILVVILGIIVGNPGLNMAVAHADSMRGVGVGIYWDQGCTNRVLSLGWGPIEPGSNHTLTVYVRNEGTSAVSLWLATSKWTPSASSKYISLNWNYSGQVLGVDQVVPLKLTLSVSPTIYDITDFSFTTIITTISHG